MSEDNFESRESSLEPMSSSPWLSYFSGSKEPADRFVRRMETYHAQTGTHDFALPSQDLESIAASIIENHKTYVQRLLDLLQASAASTSAVRTTAVSIAVHFLESSEGVVCSDNLSAASESWLAKKTEETHFPGRLAHSTMHSACRLQSRNY